MTIIGWRWRLLALAMPIAAALSAMPHSAGAETNAQLRKRVEVLEKELKEVKQQLNSNQEQTKANAQKAAEAKKEATAEDNAAIKWHLAGYGTADYTNSSAEPNSFGSGKFNPIFLVSYNDLLLFESELELSANTEGGTDIELEFANLNLMLTDWLTFTAGKFLSPIGDFQQHRHPSWINKLPDRPAGFVEDAGAEPLTEVGVMARGAFPLDSMTADYAVFVGNGPRLAEEAGEGVLLEGFGGDNNSNKAVGGRIGLHPWPFVTAGFSGMYAQVEGNMGAGGAVTEGGYDLEDIDLSYTKDYLDLRAELIRAHLASLVTALDPDEVPALIPSTTWYAWYLEAAYRLAGLIDNPILRNLEPVFRFSQFHASGANAFKENEEKRWTAGLDYWFAPSIVGKFAYERRDFRGKRDDNVFRLQFAFGF